MDGVSVKALDNVSLAIMEGEFVSIIGPSGSGKSTLMHIVGCLDTPTSGKVLLDDQEISQMTERQLAQVRNKKIGFVFQQFNLLPRTSALDNVSLPLLYNGTTSSQIAKKAAEVLGKVGLGERLDHHPNQLSGGQQQRVAIARALITDPSIIIADEPTGNLDSKSGVEVMEIFKKLHQQGRTVILVTHDDNIANKAQRIIRLKDGKVIN
jgi:putative ABC transport system ATP-binding protein